MARRPDVLRRQAGAVPPPRCIGWFLNSLGAFPIDRGAGDDGLDATPRGRSSSAATRVLIFPEGTRIRPGALGRPKRGVGRLALETGAPVVPVAVIGTEGVRRGWRIRPHKVRIRAGRPLTFPQVEHASPQLAAAVTDRIWPCVSSSGSGSAACRRCAAPRSSAPARGAPRSRSMLARAGLEVELGCRTRRAGRRGSPRRAPNERYLPGVALPETSTSCARPTLELARARPRRLRRPARATLPAAVAAHGGRIPPRAGVLVLVQGPRARRSARCPSAYVAERVAAARGRRASAAPATRPTRSPTAPRSSSPRRPRLRAPGRRRARRRRLRRRDAPPTSPASSSPAAPRTPPRSPPRPPRAAGPERRRRRRRQGLRRGRRVRAPPRRAAPETFAGLAGAGDLVATVARRRQPQPPRRRAARRRACRPSEIGSALGQAAEALDARPAARRARCARDGVDAPTLDGLAAVSRASVDAGGAGPASLTAPDAPKRRPRDRSA